MNRWSKPDCSSGKAAWRRQGDVLRAIRRIELENAQAVVPSMTQPLLAYRCPECDAWHLTTTGRGIREGATA